MFLLLGKLEFALKIRVRIRLKNAKHIPSETRSDDAIIKS